MLCNTPAQYNPLVHVNNQHDNLSVLLSLCVINKQYQLHHNHINSEPLQFYKLLVADEEASTIQSKIYRS